MLARSHWLWLVVVASSLATPCIAALPSCRTSSDEPEPGVASACNVSAVCAWCERNHLSFDFVCCEDGNWIGAHLTSPLLFYLVWNDVPATIIVVFATELVEIFVLTVFGSFATLFSDARDAETMAASALGDVLVQGGLGLALGYALRALTLAPTLVSSAARARAYNERTLRAQYIGVFVVAYALTLGFFLGASLAETNPADRYGVVAQTAVELVFAWLIYPVLVATRAGTRMIAQQADGSSWPSTRRAVFFGGWGLIVLATHVPHIVVSTAFVNEWYAQWAVAVPLTLLAYVVLALVSYARADRFTCALAVAVVFGIGWLVAWFTYALTGRTSVALLVVGAVALAFAALAAVVAAYALESGERVAIEGAGARNTLPAVAVTRAAARRIFGTRVPPTTRVDAVRIKERGE